MHTFCRTQTNPILHEAMAENEVWVNADVGAPPRARERRLREAAEPGRRRQLPVKVRATERIRPDCVYMVHGFGHTAKALRRALRKGASDSQLITRYAIDPLMGGTGMNVNFVTFQQGGLRPWRASAW